MILMHCLMNWGTNDMKKFLYIIGAIGASLVIGSTVIALFFQSKEQKKQNEQKKPNRKQFPAEDIALIKVAPIQEETKYKDVQSSAIGNMYSRHKEAANIIKNSIETIHKNVKVSENTNNEIDEVSAELDKMLGED